MNVDVKQKALFLDRDGVINVNHGYVSSKDNFDWIDGILHLIKQANKLAYKVVVVTNQSGIGRDYYAEQDFLELSDWMCQTIAAKGGKIHGIYYCPHHPLKAKGSYLKDCNCRKPKPGMLLTAASELNLDLNNSMLVGDKLSDMVAAESANLAKAYLFQNKEESAAVTELLNSLQMPVSKVQSLIEVQL